MEKIQFDSGLKTYKLGSGQLRFNPSDPNVYLRFMEACDSFRQVEQEVVDAAQCADQGDLGTAAVTLLRKADQKMKHLLGQVFPGNDLESLLQGVNLLAVADNGERVITNLLKALEPVLVAGAKRCASQTAQAAKAKAQARRAQC